MTGSNEKFATIDTAEKQYNALMEILRRECKENPYSLLPSELERIVRAYENLGAWYNSMNFRDALSTYWRSINVSSKSKQELEVIADFDDCGGLCH